MKDRRALVTPRLLNKEQAAAYCGISASSFAAYCPVAPVSLGSNKRLQRYDLHRLDEWIETLSGPKASSSKDWLAAMDGKDGDARADKRN